MDDYSKWRRVRQLRDPARVGGSNVKLGAVIRRFRTDRGISQEGLAAISGIDRTFMGEIERGEVNPSFEVLERIATGLSVRLSELISAYECERD